MTIPETPPAWLGWTNKATTRAATTLIAIIALLMSGVIMARLQIYTDCIADGQRADARRTGAIAVATDAERAADAALIRGVVPGGPDASALRAEAVAARKVTDRVRAENPPPDDGGC